MVLVASSTALLGVKVAVHVTPPSLLLTVLSVPLGAVMSSLPKPVTASLKVKVTRLVSPTLSALSLKVIATVGACVSNTCCAVALAALVLPAASLASPAPTDTDKVPVVPVWGVTTRV